MTRTYLTQLSNGDFSIMTCHHLYLPLPHQQEEGDTHCPSYYKANVGHWGGHAVTCNSTTKHRTLLWNDLARASHFDCLATS
jgi:hypothetical protein